MTVNIILRTLEEKGLLTANIRKLNTIKLNKCFILVELYLFFLILKKLRQYNFHT